MTVEIVTLIVTALTSGFVTSLVTLRFTRKQAENDAVKGVQDIYQELVDDLKRDRADLREEVRRLKVKLEGQGRIIMSIKQQLTAIRHLLCDREGCEQRTYSGNKYEIKQDADREGQAV